MTLQSLNDQECEDLSTFRDNKYNEPNILFEDVQYVNQSEIEDFYANEEVSVALQLHAF